MSQSRRMFGTDGIRGTANLHPMTVEVALKLGQAAGLMFTTGSHRHRVVIGKDTRLSGYNVQQMTGDASGLTGGVKPSVAVTTTQQGAHPFRVEFTGNLSGKNVPELEPLTAFTGGRAPRIAVSTKYDGATTPAENVVVDTDPRVEQVVSESGSQIWSRMNGVRFKHFIPPYTAKGKFEVTVSGCVPGQMITLRLPRPWSRPWGLA